MRPAFLTISSLFVLSSLSGCVHQNYYLPSRVPVSPAAITETAVSLLGKPVRYGGVSPDGFDCAGFVMYVFKAHAIPLPRTARQQAHCGQKLSYRELRPADLVFFHTKGWGQDSSHVGIYIGNHEFIHVGYSSPGGVRRDSLTNPYYKANFIFGRRILQ
jgi:cell wall-associated NlpC family hydrolase